MSVQKGERRKMYDNIDYSVEVNSIKRLAPSADIISEAVEAELIQPHCESFHSIAN